MSLILDALKKSDHERRVAAGEPFTEPRPAARRGFRGVWLVPGVLVLVIAAAAWWLKDRDWRAWLGADAGEGAVVQSESQPSVAAAAQSPAPAPVLPAGGSTTTASSPSAATPTQTPQSGKTGHSDQSPPPASTLAPRSANRNPAQGASSTAQSAKHSAARNTSVESARQRGRRADSRPTEPPPKEIYELPMDVRLQVPALVMNVHVYAQSPADRFVLINMQRLEEGEEVDGLITREIRPDGVLMEFQGHQFLLRRP